MGRVVDVLCCWMMVLVLMVVVGRELLVLMWVDGTDVG
jgi:hypothetical protein